MIKEWFEKMFHSELPLRERLFRIIISMAVVAMTLAIIVNFATQQSIYIMISLCIGLVIILLSVWVSVRYHKMELAATMLAVVIDWLMFPIIFFVSGGIESGATVWFVLGIIFIFLLFKGRKMVAVLSITLFIFACCYLLGYWHPELVIAMSTQKDVYIDSSMAVLLVGIVIGFLIKFQNIVYERERRITERQKQELESINQDKSDFFANMSHEIRTPINTIIGLNEITLRENVSDEIAENAIHIQTASKVLLSIINDILDMSKIESGKMEIIPVNYNTSTLFSEIINIIWIKAQNKELEFNIDLDRNIPSILFGDEIRIRQILINILSNAVKYTSEGSVTMTVKSEQKRMDTVELQIAIKDTGKGIRKENLKELFSSFRRVDQKENRTIEGTGLGLSIAKQLIDLMGGKIEVDSIYTKGSTFTVTFEQQVIDGTPLGTFDPMNHEKFLQRKNYMQLFEAPDARILIVDDNEMNLLVAVKLLRDTKVQIDTAHSGSECLEKTRSKSYHVIFMDHKMVGLDGVQTLHQLRKQDNGLCRNVPVIALTANVMSGAEQIYQEYGFDGYLSKPIEAIAFESMLMHYLPSELIEVSTKDVHKQNRDFISITPQQRRKPICITTECICDIPEKYIEEYEMSIMYYYVFTDQGQFQDIKEIDSDNLLHYLKGEGKHAYSSYASEKEYENFFADALENAEQVIHISIAQSIEQGGYAVAKAAASSFDHVQVYDTGHLSSGMGLMALMAAKMAQDKKPAEEIIQMLDSMKKRVSTSFIVPNLQTLYRNKLVKRAETMICEVLDIHPVLRLMQGRMRCLSFVTGSMASSYRKYIRHELRHKKNIDTSVVFITYAGCTLKQVREFENEVRKYVKFENVILQQASASISCNCGLGAMGVIFMRKS